MDSKAELRIGDGVQDGAGLELSLGLGLSSAESRQRWKAAEAASAPSSSSADPAGESSAAANINGLHTPVKPKSSTKQVGINSAIKKFLECGLDCQEEHAIFLDGRNAFSLHKERDRLLPVGSQENSSLRLDIAAADGETKGSPFLFKELHGSSGRTSSGSQSPPHTTPLQIVDAFKNTLNSNSGSPGPTEGGCNFDENDTRHDDLGKRKRFQDGQKKLKYPRDEQKHQKKSKNEETPQGLCELGSIPMERICNRDMENSSQALKRDNVRRQIQHGTIHERREFTEVEKVYETRGDERPRGEKNISADLCQHNCKVIIDHLKGAGGNFTSQLEVPESTQQTVIRSVDNSTWHIPGPIKLSRMGTNILDRENSLKRQSTGPTYFEDGQTGVAIARDGDKPCSPLQRTRDKVSSETSSISTGGTEKVNEKSQGGEASSTVPELVSDNNLPLTSILTTPICSTVPALSSVQVPYGVSPYPILPVSYPGSVSNAHGNGMPFLTGVNFPYAMPYGHPGTEGSEQNMRPLSNTAFQHPGTEYSPSFSSFEVASRMLSFRPPFVSPFTNASNGALYNRNTMDVNGKLPVSKMQDNGMGSLPPAGDPTSKQNLPFFRAVAHSGVHDQLADMSPVPHLPSQPIVSDYGDIRLLKDQNSVNLFSRFSSSVQTLHVHAPPGIGRPPSGSGNRDDVGQGEIAGSPATQEHTQACNVIEPSNSGQQEFSRAIGNEFCQGSTENVLDVLREDLAFLQQGIAPGLKFGGTGVAPNLPWVHATGPNGRTTGGVVYRSNGKQIKVVCACHGKHMSPVEFAQHAGIMDFVTVDKNVGTNTPLTTQAT